MSFVWSDDTVTQLKTLWKKGASAREIAEHFGNISRNAVIGKAHRLGLSHRAQPMKREYIPYSHLRHEKTCQWPEGDPMDSQSYHICGKQAKIGKAYCDSHYNRAYRVINMHNMHEQFSSNNS